jgi:hypothetical protein
MAKFEKEIIGGILETIFTNGFKFRKQYHDQFIKYFSDNPYFKPVQALRGEPNNHKLILLANSKEIAHKLKLYLKNVMIYCSPSYDPLFDDLTELEGMKTVLGRVIELPIENDSEKMSYLFDKLNNFKY